MWVGAKSLYTCTKHGYTPFILSMYLCPLFLCAKFECDTYPNWASANTVVWFGHDQHLLTLSHNHHHHLKHQQDGHHHCCQWWQHQKQWWPLTVVMPTFTMGILWHLANIHIGCTLTFHADSHWAHWFTLGALKHFVCIHIGHTFMCIGCAFWCIGCAFSWRSLPSPV